MRQNSKRDPILYCFMNPDPNYFTAEGETDRHRFCHIRMSRLQYCYNTGGSAKKWGGGISEQLGGLLSPACCSAGFFTRQVGSGKTYIC